MVSFFSLITISKILLVHVWNVAFSIHVIGSANVSRKYCICAKFLFEIILQMDPMIIDLLTCSVVGTTKVSVLIENYGLFDLHSCAEKSNFKNVSATIAWNEDHNFLDHICSKNCFQLLDRDLLFTWFEEKLVVRSREIGGRGVSRLSSLTITHRFCTARRSE